MNTYLIETPHKKLSIYLSIYLSLSNIYLSVYEGYSHEPIAITRSFVG